MNTALMIRIHGGIDALFVTIRLIISKKYAVGVMRLLNGTRMVSRNKKTVRLLHRTVQWMDSGRLANIPTRSKHILSKTYVKSKNS